MRKYLLCLLFTVAAVSLYSQRNVRYDVEPGIERIQDDYVNNWRRIGKINGFRIQVAAFSGVNSRSQAESVRYTIDEIFPHAKSYVVYSEPYFRVQVGDFKTRLEAYKFLIKVRESYHGAYIVPEKINYR